MRSSLAIVFAVVIVLVVVSAGSFLFKKIPLFEPEDETGTPYIEGDGVCDSELGETGADCEVVEEDEEEPFEEPPPNPSCVGSDGKVMVGYAPDPDKPCRQCDDYGWLDTGYSDGKLLEGELCKYCYGEEVSLLDTELTGCTYCQNGEYKEVEDGKPASSTECTVCQGGKETPHTGNFPGDTDNYACEKCLVGNIINKDPGESCNVGTYFYNNLTKLSGKCTFSPIDPEVSLDEEIGFCQCTVTECQPGQKKYAKPVNDPINNQKGYQECKILFAYEDESICSKWPPANLDIRACDTCAEDFDAALGCKKYTKQQLKDRAKVGYACKYKSFWSGKIKDGLCTKGGGCSGLKLHFFSFISGLNDKVNEVIECEALAKKKGISLGGGFKLEYEKEVITDKKSGYQYNLHKCKIYELDF